MVAARSARDIWRLRQVRRVAASDGGCRLLRQAVRRRSRYVSMIQPMPRPRLGPHPRNLGGQREKSERPGQQDLVRRAQIGAPIDIQALRIDSAKAVCSPSSMTTTLS